MIVITLYKHFWFIEDFWIIDDIEEFTVNINN